MLGKKSNDPGGDKLDYIYDPNSGELYHYGIKGMKWGVRRFQDKSGRLTAAGKERYSDDETEERKGLTDKQKKYIKIGAAAVATGLAIYGGYKIHQLYTGAGQDIDPSTGFRLINKEMTDKENLLAVNPGRVRRLSTHRNMEIIDGSSTNCMLCTNAYELRKRGYDVHAGFDKHGRGYMPDFLFPKLYSDYKGTTKIQLSEIEDFAKREGPGSRGNIMVWWKQGGGHSMIWENIDGNVVIKDGQTNSIYKKDSFMWKLMQEQMDKGRPVEMLRTDNLTLNTKEMKRYVNSDTVLKTYVDHGGEIALKTANDPVVKLTASAALYGGINHYANKAAIKKYKQQHPRTKLSDKEIRKLLIEAHQKGAK